MLCGTVRVLNGFLRLHLNKDYPTWRTLEDRKTVLIFILLLVMASVVCTQRLEVYDRVASSAKSSERRERFRKTRAKTFASASSGCSSEN